jgi:hypothetical protein
MWAFTLATLRIGRRMPLLGLLAGLGVAALAIGLGLGIYALSSDPAAQARLAQESVAGTAALGALWLLARALDQDARSGFCLAADQTAAGARARLAGRWLGAVLAGAACALPAAACAWGWAGSSPGYLLLAIILPSGLLAAWALLLGVLGMGGVSIFGACGLLWLAGHLPWGAPGWGGPWARGVAAWLPPGTSATGSVRLEAVLAMLGLLGVALALGRPTEARAARSARPPDPGQAPPPPQA